MATLDETTGTFEVMRTPKVSIGDLIVADEIVGIITESEDYSYRIEDLFPVGKYRGYPVSADWEPRSGFTFEKIATYDLTFEKRLIEALIERELNDGIDYSRWSLH